MPSGPPPTGLLTSRKIRAFTLDTSVLRASGFRLEQGALRQLSHQLPPWLSLWMSSVVLEEVSRQRAANVQAAADQAKLAWGNLNRHLDRSEDAGAMAAKADQLASLANEYFSGQMSRFIQSHAGQVVGLSWDGLAPAMFRAYFSGAAPFSTGNKKHEFPDAAALLSLEALAAQRSIFVLAVSMDDGWHHYGDSSERIYCLRGLSDLAGLYRSTGPETQMARAALSAYFRSTGPTQDLNLGHVVRDGLREVDVIATAPAVFTNFVGVEVTDLKLTAFQVDPEAIGVWMTSGKRNECAAEIAIECTIEFQVCFFARVAARGLGPVSMREEATRSVVRTLPLNLALALHTVDRPTALPQAISHVSLVPTEYRLRLVEDEVPGSIRELLPWYWREMDDDIPF